MNTITTATELKKTMTALQAAKVKAAEAASKVSELEDAIKAYMEEQNTDIVRAGGYKATNKVVTSTRIDTTALKKDLPEIASTYSKTVSATRFTFGLDK